MKVTYGYNGQKYWGRAHRTGCQDIRREDWQSGPIDTDVDSVRALVEEMTSDFLSDYPDRNWTHYENDISLAPCLTLPREA